MLFVCPNLGALTANQVDFEFHKGIYRVIVHYTVPALKEFRQATVEFRSKKKAEAFYFAVLRGADFYFGDPKGIEFINERKKPDPW